MKQSYTALLVLAAQGGDKQAFNQLCELHYQASYRFAYKLCQSPQDAGDITQEVWSKVAKDIRSLLEPGAFKAWLFRAIYRRFIDVIRRQYKEQGIAEAPLVAAQPISLEQSLDMLSLIARLPWGERHTVYLFYLEELAISDIAVVLDIPQGTVKSRLHKARRRLSQWAQQ